MSKITSTSFNQSNSSSSTDVSSPSIQNFNVLANVEQAIALPSGTRKFSIRHRLSSKFEVRYAAAAANYFTNMPGNVFIREGLSPTPTYTLYITAVKDGVLEVESWS